MYALQNSTAQGAPLIPIIVDTYGPQAVSARELHRFVESSERFSKWIERMFDYGFTEGADYTPYQKVHPLNKQSFKDFALTMDTAKEVAMIQRNERGRMARKYFIECEKHLRNGYAQVAGLVQVVNELLKEVADLRRGIVRAQKDYSKAYEAKVLEADSLEVANLVKREKIVTYVNTVIRRSMNGSWDEFWKQFEASYNIDVQEIKQTPGETKLDAVIRKGYLEYVYQYINLGR